MLAQRVLKGDTGDELINELVELILSVDKRMQSGEERDEEPQPNSGSQIRKRTRPKGDKG